MPRSINSKMCTNYRKTFRLQGRLTCIVCESNGLDFQLLVFGLAIPNRHRLYRCGFGVSRLNINMIRLSGHINYHFDFAMPRYGKSRKLHRSCIIINALKTFIHQKKRRMSLRSGCEWETCEPRNTTTNQEQLICKNILHSSETTKIKKNTRWNELVSDNWLRKYARCKLSSRTPANVAAIAAVVGAAAAASVAVAMLILLLTTSKTQLGIWIWVSMMWIVNANHICNAM